MEKFDAEIMYYFYGEGPEKLILIETAIIFY